MIENLNLIKAEMRRLKCLSFEEAEVILKPILGTDCLKEFLEITGYIDCYGLPEKSLMLNRDLFRFVHFENDDPGYISPGVVYWITHTGMVSIFRKALSYYHKDSVIKATECKRQEHITQTIEKCSPPYVFSF
jgi:hypothetical protein